MGLDVSRIKVNEMSLQRFCHAMSSYQLEMHKSAEETMRRCTIDLLKSLRRRTAKSKKKRIVEQVRSGGRPVWLTAKHGALKGQRVKLFRVNVHQHWVRRVGKKISEVRKTRIVHIIHQGLAKRSWGWAMHKLFNIPEPEKDGKKILNQAVETKWESRDQSLHCEVVNTLDYISNALRKGALGASMTAAAKLIERKVKMAHERNARKAGLA